METTKENILTYPSIDAWLDETEVFSSRRERLISAIESRDFDQVMLFMRTSWLLGQVQSSQRHSEATEALSAMLDAFGGYVCPEVDQAITVMQALGKDRWSMVSKLEEREETS